MRSSKLDRIRRLASLRENMPGKSSASSAQLNESRSQSIGAITNDAHDGFQLKPANLASNSEKNSDSCDSHQRRTKDEKRKRAKHTSRPSDPRQFEDDAFDTLEINDVITQWLKTKNITKMTRVQRLTIPKLLGTRKDVLVQSHTGSGKTLCFVIPMLDSFLKAARKHQQCSVAAVYSVIMLPTRELATQVHSVISDAVDHIGNNQGLQNSAKSMTKDTFSCLVLIGGYSVDQDVRAITKLKDTNKARPFLIATPGRLRHLMDLLQQAMVWTFKDLSLLVLDEADRLLEMGYQNDMATIMGNLPKHRTTGFFSATLPADVMEFANRVLRTYDYINADSKQPDGQKNNKVTDETPSNPAYATPTSLDNFYLVLDPREKLHFVVMFLEHLREMGVKKCAIFFLTCDIVDYFSLMLDALIPQETGASSKQPATLFYKIHRKMHTSKRQQSLKSFRGPPPEPNGRKASHKQEYSKVLQVLLCTDVFSRGIDIPQIEWVIQYDAPQDPNFFVHRIGRVSRAGAAGKALLLLNTNEEAYVQFQLNRKIPLKPLDQGTISAVKEHCNYAEDTRSRLSQEPPTGTTTVNNGTPYISYLESTEPDNPVLPWGQTCKLLSFLRSRTTSDRTYLQAASRAFVSFTRAYTEHRLSSIFEEKKLDYGGLATSLGVLRVPRVKEILGRKLTNFANCDTDPQTVAFKNEAQEQQRLKQLEEAKERRQEKPKKKVEEAPKVQRTRTEKRMAKREHVIKEWEELSREERLAKKLKRKKITAQQYERMLSGHEPSESDSSDDSDYPGQKQKIDKEESDWEAELDNFMKECGDRPPAHITSKQRR